MKHRTSQIIYLFTVFSALVHIGPIKAENPIVLHFAGDVTLANHFERFVDDDYDYPFRKFKWFADADISMINLENPLTLNGSPREKLFNFKALPQYVKTLKAGGVDIVTLANNHIYDFSELGLRNTLTALDEVNIKYVGAGRNLKEARKPVIFTIDGIHIAYLAYYGLGKHSNSQPAETYASGTAMRSLQFIREDIRSLRKNVDFIIINFHWGLEKQNIPQESQIWFAHQVIDYGADLIIGHHPHVLQGIELYNNRIIAYSLGNFIFGGNSRTYEETAVLSIKIDPQQIIPYQTEVQPVIVDHWQPRKADEHATVQVMDSLRTYSSVFAQSIFEN
ncbi:MAG: hypothetical protein GF313_02695 [Caldithrix sp.]|nr:hypothetical protein [Caldithrix sp.]